MARIFKGLDIATRINATIREQLAALKCRPYCVVLYDAADQAMRAYMQRQTRAAAEIGINLVFEPYAICAVDVSIRVAELAADPSVDAVITLYPLPNGVDGAALALALGPEKDVDGLHPWNAGNVLLGHKTRAPATAQACLMIARSILGTLKGRVVALVGASPLIGRPLANLLLDDQATVCVTHAATRDLVCHTRAADLVITAAGQPGLITAVHLREQALVLDVSIIPGERGLVGDVDLTSLDGHDVTVSHVPDGVGPVTTACLMKNIADAALLRR
jgi:methylenetetrahydrofolate dehydrogenase (NADP+)/methenyltetrahydrofolate cyclohydrolase